jgi:hypothetical protein
VHPFPKSCRQRNYFLLGSPFNRSDVSYPADRPQVLIEYVEIDVIQRKKVPQVDKHIFESGLQMEAAAYPESYFSKEFIAIHYHSAPRRVLKL